MQKLLLLSIFFYSTLLGGELISTTNDTLVIDYRLFYNITGFILVVLLFLMFYWNRRLHQEIAKKEQVEKELSKLSQVIEQSQVSIIITNTNGIIEYVNKFCEFQTQYSEKELIGQNPNILKSGYQDVEFYKNLWDTITSGENWHGELSNRKKNGEFFWESAVIAPLFDKNNKIKSYVAIKEDITQKVQDRENLEIAKAQALEATNAKSEFLAKMSHEIRTPMNAILGMLYLLEHTELSVVQSDYLKKASQATNSLLDLINDILDFSKIEAGKLELLESNFNFNEMLSETLGMMSIKAAQNELELLAEYDQSIPKMLISDKARIKQILNNLISNAIKFTKKGEIIVTTSLINSHFDTVEILICVKDSGIGISKKNQSKLFLEFSQVDNSNTRDYEGTGLGLAISKKLTHLFDGKLWLENSKEGVGSTFCFSIKVKIGRDMEELQPLEHSLNTKNLKCLIVDDNQAAIDILSKMLLSFGYSVETLTQGTKVLDKIQNNFYDLIFLDYKMDDMNGLEVYKQIKKELHNETKTIIVTAYMQELIEKEIKQLGIAGYLSKPISPSMLYKKIVEVKTTSSVTLEKEQQKIKKFKHPQVLLVEDNPLNQEFIIQILKVRDIEIEVANDGIEALNKVKKKNIDLVLMDIQMPHMDGWEATKMIRAMDGDYFQTLPIIALSANAMISDKEKSLSIGMNAHLNKPINPDLLFETLEQYLETYEVSIKQPIAKNTLLDGLEKTHFDIEKTLQRLSGDEETYIKLLKHFKERYKNIFNEILQLIQKGDLIHSEKKIHEIKGVSGNLGATLLFEIISKIDILLKQNTKPKEALLEEFSSELEKVFENISKLKIVSVLPKEFDKQKVSELLESILYNLEVDIVKSQESLNKVLPYLQSNYAIFAQNLTNAVDMFDSDSVRDLINDFRRSCHE